MKSLTIFTALLGAAAASPGLSMPREARRAVRRDAARGHKGPSLNMRNNSYPQYSTNWAGAVQIGNEFNRVQGTVTVPQVSGDASAAAAAWVGIDGDTCQSAILQTGVSFYGDGSFDAWYEWIPDYSHSFTGFSMRAGDQIKMSVDASSTTGGVAVLENMSNGQSVSHTFTNPPSTLCETNAEWIVEDFQNGGQLVPLINFGTVTFTDASASGSGGNVTPEGANIIDIRDQSGNVLTDCSASGNDVVCRYTGS